MKQLADLDLHFYMAADMGSVELHIVLKHSYQYYTQFLHSINGPSHEILVLMAYE